MRALWSTVGVLYIAFVMLSWALGWPSWLVLTLGSLLWLTLWYRRYRATNHRVDAIKARRKAGAAMVIATVLTVGTPAKDASAGYPVAPGCVVDLVAFTAGATIMAVAPLPGFHWTAIVGGGIAAVEAVRLMQTCGTGRLIRGVEHRLDGTYLVWGLYGHCAGCGGGGGGGGSW